MPEGGMYWVRIPGPGLCLQVGINIAGVSTGTGGKITRIVPIGLHRGNFPPFPGYPGDIDPHLQTKTPTRDPTQYIPLLGHAHGLVRYAWRCQMDPAPGRADARLRMGISLVPGRIRTRKPRAWRFQGLKVVVFQSLLIQVTPMRLARSALPWDGQATERITMSKSLPVLPVRRHI